jgi:hypothetical protein
MTYTTKRLEVERLFSSTAGERWFGDGHPGWREGAKGPRLSMSRREAREQRLKDVKMLRRHAKANGSGLRLADLIESCAPGNRCLSGACIECNRAIQRLFVEASECLLRGSAVPVTAISIVLKKAWIPQGNLINPFELFEPLSRHLQQALLRAGVRQAIGGFDISANEHACGSFSPHYRPHAYVFVPTNQFTRAERAFRAFFPISNAVRRPVVARNFDGRRNGLAYAWKRDFQRRITLPRHRLSDGTIVRRNTRDRPLRALQKVELALALHRLGLGARVFLHGLRIASAQDKIHIVRSVLEPPNERRANGPPHRDATPRFIKSVARRGKIGAPTQSNAKRPARIRSADKPRPRGL